MSDPRPTFAMLIDPDRGVVTSLDLPDAEHIHVTRHPDGTITATPMRQARRRDHEPGCVVEFGWACSCCAAPSWVDCPTGGDQ